MAPSAAIVLIVRARVRSRRVTPWASWLESRTPSRLVAQLDVGVVVGRLGGPGDPGDHLQARGEVAGVEPRVQRAEEEPPVVEAVLGRDLGVAERLLRSLTAVPPADSPGF